MDTKTFIELLAQKRQEENRQKNAEANISQARKDLQERIRQFDILHELNKAADTRAQRELELRQEAQRHGQEAAAQMGIAAGTLRPSENIPTTSIPSQPQSPLQIPMSSPTLPPGMQGPREVPSIQPGTPLPSTLPTGTIAPIQGPGQEPGGVQYGSQNLHAIPPEEQQAQAQSAAALLHAQQQHEFMNNVNNFAQDDPAWAKKNADRIHQMVLEHITGEKLTKPEDSLNDAIQEWAKQKTTGDPKSTDYKFAKAQFDTHMEVLKTKALANPITQFNLDAKSSASAILARANQNAAATPGWNQMDPHQKSTVIHGQINNIISDPAKAPPGTHPSILAEAGMYAHRGVPEVAPDEDPIKQLTKDAVKSLFEKQGTVPKAPTAPLAPGQPAQPTSTGNPPGSF